VLEVLFCAPVSSYSIEIVQYDPSWPAAYAQEERRIAEAIGSHVVRFEHMGSTAVPGLAAKPIIDISAAVSRLEGVPSLFPALRALGYEPIPQESPDRFDLWRQPTNGPPTHILHFMELDSEAWIRPLIFRNALRADPDLRAEYISLKQTLADTCASDIKEYGKGKTEFITKVLEAMLTENRQQG
jgi:GrpB-like predicted nucleotidyltransferase (UPF0157 family)